MATTITTLFILFLKNDSHWDIFTVTLIFTITAFLCFRKVTFSLFPGLEQSFPCERFGEDDFHLLPTKSIMCANFLLTYFRLENLLSGRFFMDHYSLAICFDYYYPVCCCVVTLPFSIRNLFNQTSLRFVVNNWVPRSCFLYLYPLTLNYLHCQRT